MVSKKERHTGTPYEPAVGNELLLTISEDVATIQNKKELLDVINLRLRPLFYFTHSHVAIIDEEKNCYSPFLLDTASKSRTHAEFKFLTIRKYPVKDGFVEDAIRSSVPVVFDLEELIDKKRALSLAINFETGSKEILVAVFRNEKGSSGALAFFSDKKGSFKDVNPGIIQGIANQLSLAVANIQANEEKEQREKEKEILLSISQDLLSVRDKNKLLDVINARLKKHFYFYHSSMIRLSDDEQYYTAFLLDPASASRDHPQYDQIVKGWHPLATGTMDKALQSEVPLYFDLDNFAVNEDMPVFIRLNHDAGIKEMAMVRLRNNGRNIGLFVLYSDKRNVFTPEYLALLYRISHQLSVVVSNVIANEEIQRRESEMGHLLSLNHLVATIKDRNDLLQIINGHLRSLLYFTYSTTMIISDDRETFSMFLLDPNSMAGNHPDYKPITENRLPVNDGIFSTAIHADRPTVFDIQSLMDNSAGEYPPYIKMYHESGIKEFVAAPLKNEKETFGLMALYSDRKNNFNENNLNIIQGIASLVAIAATNILAGEQIRRREKEKETLLAISYEMAKIRDKGELLGLINNKLKNLFYFTHCSISVIHWESNTFSIYLTDPETKSKQHPRGEQMLRSSFPINDGFFENFLLSEEPSVSQYETIIKKRDAPLYARIHYEIGLKEIISIPLYREKEIWGVLHFYSDRQDTFTAGHLDIIKGVASQVSIAISNIEANEEIRLRDTEQETLLALGNEMARIRDKNELLTLINTRLKKLFYFTHSSISAINPDRNTFYIYLTDPESRSRQHAAYEELVTSSYPVHDRVFETFLQSDEPTVSLYENVIALPEPPLYSIIHYEAGLREAVSIPLYGEKEIWGVLHFYSDKTKTFTPNYFNIIKGVASQMAIAVANIIANEQVGIREKEKATLLSISYEIGKVRDKNELLTFINTKLKNLFYFTHSSISVINEDRETFKVFLTDPQSKSREHADYVSLVTTTYPIKGSVFETFLRSDEPVVNDVEKVAKGPNAPSYSRIHFEAGLREAVAIRLHGENQLWGVLHFYSDIRNAFTRNNLNIIKGVASQVAIAVSNILAHEDVRQREKEKTLLLSFSHDIASLRDKKKLALVINQYLKQLSLVKEYIISVKNDDHKTHSYFLYDAAASFAVLPGFERVREAKITIAGGLTEAVLKSQEPLTINLRETIEKGELEIPAADFWLSSGIDIVTALPLRVGNEDIGILWMHPERPNLRLLKGISAQIAIAIANIMANEKIEHQLEEINKYKSQLEEENLYLQEEVEGTYKHSELVGSGAEMKKVFHLVSTVSFSNSTVLILGETGTGKELIARAIHNASSRKDKLMVKVNCAALPANLIESELFGHERGSFTGATEKRIGKFELANHSTLFLDEIGEMPLDLQVKLLRALQEKEIERVGGKTTIKVDVRIIAATNRQLQKEVEAGRFRSDLYYRLNVFPITLPPLRDRKEDLPVLVSYFIGRFAKNAGKRINNISHKVLQDMMAYHWPGNVRELEHLVERSVLLTNGNTIKEMHLPLRERTDGILGLEDYQIKTIDANERDHILYVLKRCKGKVSGAGGADELLGIPGSTLTSKMKKLNIKKEHFFKD